MSEARQGRNGFAIDVAGFSLYALGICLHAFRSTRWLGPVILLFACKVILRGKRLRAESAESLLARDPRSPILYLRSFAEDESVATGSLHEKGLMLRTAEELLASAFRRSGPFVCIGRPDEELPQLGAARLYAPAGEWKPRVQDLMRRARLIVIHLGSGSGLWWEIEQAVTLSRSRNLLFFIPLGGGPAYERLRQFWSAHFGQSLPALGGSLPFPTIGEQRPEAHFLYWNSRGEPEIQAVLPGILEPGMYADRQVLRALALVFHSLGLVRPSVPFHPYVKWAALFLIPAAFLSYRFDFAPQLARSNEKLRVAQARLGVLALHISLVRMRERTGHLPRSDQWQVQLATERAIPESLREAHAAKGQLVDPWGFPYQYVYPGRLNPDGFDVGSFGADGREGGTGANTDIWNVGGSFTLYDRPKQ